MIAGGVYVDGLLCRNGRDGDDGGDDCDEFELLWLWFTFRGSEYVTTLRGPGWEVVSGALIIDCDELHRRWFIIRGGVYVEGLRCQNGRDGVVSDIDTASNSGSDPVLFSFGACVAEFVFSCDALHRRWFIIRGGVYCGTLRAAEGGLVCCGGPALCGTNSALKVGGWKRIRCRGGDG